MAETKAPDGDELIDSRWHSILEAVVAVQAVLPEAIMIGGSAITAHTGHRLSSDADMVMRNPDRDWRTVRGELEELDGWITDYPKIPTNPMGRYDDARVSVRKLSRLRDIELAEVIHKGRTLRLATPDELVRMKAMAILTRNITRDYVDLVALHAGLLEAGRSATTAIIDLDRYYSEHKTAGSLARQTFAALADPCPDEPEPSEALGRADRPTRGSARLGTGSTRLSTDRRRYRITS